MAEASGDFIITMDDDLQHRPEEIPRLIEFENHDLVIAQFSEKKHSYLRTAASSVKSKFDLFLLGVPRSVRLSPFRLIRREVVEKALRLEWPYPFIPALLFNVTTDAVGVGVAHDFRFDGNSGYTGPKLIRVFGRMLFNYLTAGKFGRKMIELLRPFLKSASEWPPYQIGNIEARRDNSSIYHRDGPVRNNAAG